MSLTPNTALVAKLPDPTATIGRIPIGDNVGGYPLLIRGVNGWNAAPPNGWSSLDDARAGLAKLTAKRHEPAAVFHVGDAYVGTSIERYNRAYSAPLDLTTTPHADHITSTDPRFVGAIQGDRWLPLAPPVTD